MQAGKHDTKTDRGPILYPLDSSRTSAINGDTHRTDNKDLGPNDHGPDNDSGTIKIVKGADYHHQPSFSESVSESNDNTAAALSWEYESPSFEVFSRNPSDIDKEELLDQLKKERKEKLLLQQKVKGYHTLGELYQEAKEELGILKGNHNSISKLQSKSMDYAVNSFVDTQVNTEEKPIRRTTGNRGTPINKENNQHSNDTGDENDPWEEEEDRFLVGNFKLGKVSTIEPKQFVYTKPGTNLLKVDEDVVEYVYATLARSSQIDIITFIGNLLLKPRRKYSYQEGITFMEISNNAVETLSDESKQVYLYQHEGNQDCEKLFLLSLFLSTCLVIDTEDDATNILEHLRYLPHLLNFTTSKDNNPESKAHNIPRQKWQLLVLLHGVDESQEDEVISPEDYFMNLFEDAIEKEELDNIVTAIISHFPERMCIICRKEETVNRRSVSEINELVARKIVKMDVDDLYQDQVNYFKHVLNSRNTLFSECAETNLTEGEGDIIASVMSAYGKEMALKLNAALPVDKSVLKRVHQTAHKNALELFHAKRQSCGMKENKDRRIESALEGKLKIEYHKYVQENNTLSREKCLLLLQHLFTELDENIERMEYSHESGYEDYLRDRDVAVESYNQIAGKGPMAKHVLDEVLHKRKIDAQKIKEPHKKIPNDDTAEMYKTNDDMDAITRAQTICDTVCKSLELPSSELSLQIGPQLIEFSLRAMNLEKQRNKFKALLQGKTEEADTLKAEMQEMMSTVEKKDEYILKLRKTIADKAQNSEYKPTTSTEVSTGTPLSSIPPKEWVHVVEEHNNMVEKESKQYKTDESTEREHEYLKKLDKCKGQIKELVQANSEWEEHCTKIQEQHKMQLNALVRELRDSKQLIKDQQLKVENTEAEIIDLKEQNETKLQEYEHQRSKAVNFATTQATKFDNLKKEYQQEKFNVQDLTDQVEHLTSVVGLQKEEIDQAYRTVNILKQAKQRNTPSLPSVTPSPNGSIVNLTVENRPQPPSYTASMQHQRQQQQQLLQNRNDTENVDVLRTEILVLKQQVTIFKEDFDNERKDRERAQSEIASMKNIYTQQNDDIRALEDELKRRLTEIEALRAAREQDRFMIQKKEEEINQLNVTLRQSSASNRDLQTQIDILRRKQEQYERQQQQQQNQYPQHPPTYNFVRSQSGSQYQSATPVLRGSTHSPTPRRPPVQSPATEFLSREWLHQIQSNYTKFHMNLRTEEVIMRLYAQGLIHYTQKQKLDALQVEYKKADYIITDVVMKGTKNDLAAFKQILLDTHQTDLALCLPGPRVSPVYHRPKWTCTVCTYDNVGERSNCEMCGSDAPRTGTLGNNQSPNREQRNMYRTPRMVARGIDQCDVDGDENDDDADNMADLNHLQWVKPADHENKHHYNKTKPQQAKSYDFDLEIDAGADSDHNNGIGMDVVDGRQNYGMVPDENNVSIALQETGGNEDEVISITVLKGMK